MKDSVFLKQPDGTYAECNGWTGEPIPGGMRNRGYRPLTPDQAKQAWDTSPDPFGPITYYPGSL